MAFVLVPQPRLIEALRAHRLSGRALHHKLLLDSGPFPFGHGESLLVDTEPRAGCAVVALYGLAAGAAGAGSNLTPLPYAVLWWLGCLVVAGLDSRDRLVRRRELAARQDATRARIAARSALGERPPGSPLQ